MREIASFQNGVNIIGQPEYVVLYEDYHGYDRGVKIRSYTQWNFKEKIRKVLHKFLVFSLLLLGFASCSPESVLDEVEPVDYSFVKDKGLYGQWEYANGDVSDPLFIYALYVTHITNGGKNSDVYETKNSTITQDANGFKIVGNNGKTLEFKKQSKETAYVNGRLYYKVN